MMAKSHVVLGLATWFVAAPMLHLPMLDPSYLTLAVAGSLLPDLDHPKSWVGHRLRPLSTVAASPLGHRGVTHSALAVLALGALLLHVGYRRGAVSALVLGYMSHLAADMLTPQGLRLAWPFRWNWGVPICRTGSPAEAVVVTVIVCAVAGWSMWHGGHWYSGLPHMVARFAR